MKIRITFTKYDSKLATFVSLLQTFVGFIIIYCISFIPTFIYVLIAGDDMAFTILCAVDFFATIAAHLCIMFLVNPDKIEEKHTKTKSSNTTKQDTDKLMQLFCLQNDMIINNLEKIKLYYQVYNYEQKFTENKDIITEKCKAFQQKFEDDNGAWSFYTLDAYSALRSRLQYIFFAVGLYYLFDLNCIEDNFDNVINKIATIVYRESKKDNSPLYYKSWFAVRVFLCSEYESIK